MVGMLMQKFFLLNVILIVGCFSQATMAEKFEVIKSNASKYSQNQILTGQDKVELNAGEFFILKALSSGQKFLIDGPYHDSSTPVVGKKCKKDTLADILTCIGGAAKDCKMTTVSGILKCITTPILPNVEDEDTPKETVVKALWEFGRSWFVRQAVPSKGKEPSVTHQTTPANVPTDPWMLVAFLDQDFCYRSNEPLKIWPPEALTSQLLVLANPEDSTTTEESAESGKNSITLHKMPDESKLPSNTFKAVWMAEQGCYRQAQLLLSPP
jgi:hypothetical protein